MQVNGDASNRSASIHQVDDKGRSPMTFLCVSETDGPCLDNMLFCWMAFSNLWTCTDQSVFLRHRSRDSNIYKTETLDCCPASGANMNMVREAAQGPGCVHFLCVELCWSGLMLCDWGQCCQQSRDIDAAQVPPCINVGVGRDAHPNLPPSDT